MSLGPESTRGRSRAAFALTLVPIVLSSWLAGAHFLRFYAFELVALFLLLPLLLLVRRSWAVRILQGFLFVAFLMWLRTTWNLAAARVAEDQPWERLALILGAVALLTLASVLLLETGPFRERYSLRTSRLFGELPPAG